MPFPVDLSLFAQIKATGNLPSPRGVALAIMRITHNENVSTAELAQTIKVDPAFVGRLIKVANSAVFRRRAIVSVQEALMVVGIPAVRSMALGFSLLSNYRKGTCPEFDYTRFWASSVIMGLTMQILSPRIRMVAADELFSIGLLARIGELALATVYPVKYGQLLTKAAASESGSVLLELEQQSLAMTHPDLGAAMLMDWGIPSAFAKPIRYFERFLESPFSSLDERGMVIMQGLALAKCVADICLGKPDKQQQLIGKAIRLAAHLGCVREAFIEDYNEVARQWVEWSKLLQLDAQEPPSLNAMSAVETDATESGASPERDEPSRETAPRATAMPDVRALLITCDAVMRGQLSKAFGEMGIVLFEYPGLEDLLEHILDVQPQILVLDVEDDMARIDRLIRTLRASRLGRGIFILLMLPGKEEKYIAAIEAGADDFFIKPVGARMLQVRLNAAQRVVLLQQELEHEREELRRFAADLSISNRSLQEAALTDSLTGLPNRRYAIERIQQEWAASNRSARPLACMVIDIDNFKQVNDVYGHDVGDMVLRLVSETMRRVLRSQDVICRTGGDEFLVVCPETSQGEVVICGERLRKEVENLTVTNENEVLDLSISVGVAVRDDLMSSSADLIKKADRAALRAKQLGRNQVAMKFDAKDDFKDIQCE